MNMRWVGAKIAKGLLPINEKRPRLHRCSCPDLSRLGGEVTVEDDSHGEAKRLIAFIARQLCVLLSPCLCFWFFSDFSGICPEWRIF